MGATAKSLKTEKMGTLKRNNSHIKAARKADSEFSKKQVIIGMTQSQYDLDHQECN